MTAIPRNPVNDSSARAGEETLRLIATLPAPEGLEDRIKARLESTPRRVLFWPLDWPGGAVMHGSAVRAAAAAAIVFVVAGGGWGIYTRVQPAARSNVMAMPPRVNPAGGFSSAGAMRTPQTLNGPVVTHQVNEAPAPTKEMLSGAPAMEKSHRTKATQRKQAERIDLPPAR